jgi:flavin reductase (DIM6/NTAB) family NADH-FMN oxidoreductase RutF
MLIAHVHALTSTDDSDLRGCAVPWVTQVSADQVLVSIREGSPTLAAALATGRFALSSLAEGQLAVARALAADPAERLPDLMTVTLANGCPGVAGSLQALGCEVVRAFDLDGQVLLVGRVRERRPLHVDRAPLRAVDPSWRLPAGPVAVADTPALTVRLSAGRRPECLPSA